MSALVLIGPMAVGKTSVGRRVARALGLTFTDTDAAVVREHGPVEQIFREHGERAFREWEREAVASALSTGGVVSLGGGAVLHPDTQAELAQHRVVLLTVKPAVVASRLRATTRPLLQGEDALSRWTTILRDRLPVYESLADAVFDTSTGPMQSVVDAVADWARDAEEAI